MPSPSAETAASRSSEKPIGAIIGGVLGGVAVVIAIAVVLVILLRRRRRKRRHNISISALFDPPSEPPEEPPKPILPHHIPAGTSNEKKGPVMLQWNDISPRAAEGQPQIRYQTDASDTLALAEMRAQFELMAQRMARMEAELGPPDYASRIAD
ncbi:hypothetical protein V5O48_012521 [Marasmius crinis-equi]|uniref:Uncharacterized protein n=1 Tax=Marasmius crinis-equi TaxID=585013 RepID=A0ABR3F2U8_9AGAR